MRPNILIFNINIDVKKLGTLKRLKLVKIRNEINSLYGPSLGKLIVEFYYSGVFRPWSPRKTGFNFPKIHREICILSLEFQLPWVNPRAISPLE